MTQTQSRQTNPFSPFKTGACAVAIVFAAMASKAAPSESSQEAVSKESVATLAPVIGVSSFGLKGDGYNGQATSGIMVGAQYAHPSGFKNVSWEAGLHYLEAGGETGNIFNNTKTQLSYLSLPLGARWQFMEFGESNEKFLYLKGGLSPNFLLNAKSKSSFFGESSETDIKSQMNSFDLMVYGGLGMTYAMGSNQSLGAELNYFKGTQKVFKDRDIKTDGFVAAVMYSFSL